MLQKITHSSFLKHLVKSFRQLLQEAKPYFEEEILTVVTQYFQASLVPRSLFTTYLYHITNPKRTTPKRTFQADIMHEAENCSTMMPWENEISQSLLQLLQTTLRQSKRYLKKSYRQNFGA